MSQKSSTSSNINNNNNNNKQFLGWIVPGSTDFYSSSFSSYSIKSTNSISHIGLTNSARKPMAGKMDDQDIHLLEGEMISKDGFSSGIDQTSFDTLDEPVRVTLLRDLQSVASKMKYILFPISRTEIRKHFLRDWDLWGPLLLCTFMALFLHHYSHDDDDDHIKKSGPQLSELFGLIWFGSYIVSINFKMLAVSPNPRRRVTNTKTICPSIFQLLCVFGYCLSPPCVGLLFLNIFKFIFDSDTLFIVKLAIGSTICFAWPTLSCYQILSQFQDKDKITLAFYPIALFYFVVSWIIITSH